MDAEHNRQCLYERRRSLPAPAGCPQRMHALQQKLQDGRGPARQGGSAGHRRPFPDGHHGSRRRPSRRSPPALVAIRLPGRPIVRPSVLGRPLPQLRGHAQPLGWWLPDRHGRLGSQGGGCRLSHAGLAGLGCRLARPRPRLQRGPVLHRGRAGPRHRPLRRAARPRRRGRRTRLRWLQHRLRPGVWPLRLRPLRLCPLHRRRPTLEDLRRTLPRRRRRCTVLRRPAILHCPLTACNQHSVLHKAAPCVTLEGRVQHNDSRQ